MSSHITQTYQAKVNAIRRGAPAVAGCSLQPVPYPRLLFLRLMRLLRFLLLLPLLLLWLLLLL